MSAWRAVLEAALFGWVVWALWRTPRWWRYGSMSEAELVSLAELQREREHRERLRRYRSRQRRRARARRKHEQAIPSASPRRRRRVVAT